MNFIHRWALAVLAITALSFLAAAPALIVGTIDAAWFWEVFVRGWPFVLVTTLAVNGAYEVEKRP